MIALECNDQSCHSQSQVGSLLPHNNCSHVYVMISGQFFFFLCSCVRFLEKTWGSWEHLEKYFYTGTQSGLKVEI